MRKSARRNDEVAFVLASVVRQTEIDRLVPKVMPNLGRDAAVWMCYPKGISKDYACDSNCDTGFGFMGDYDLEGVRIVAIDDDWSAPRFLKIDFIKTMKCRSMALSKRECDFANTVSMPPDVAHPSIDSQPPRGSKPTP
jgi:hypothetical protein